MISSQGFKYEMFHGAGSNSWNQCDITRGNENVRKL